MRAATVFLFNGWNFNHGLFSINPQYANACVRACASEGFSFRRRFLVVPNGG